MNEEAPMTIQWLCEEIARGFLERGVHIRNQVTGRSLPNLEGHYDWRDVYEWSSRGELFHIATWYMSLYPERVDEDGNLHRTAVPAPIPREEPQS